MSKQTLKHPRIAELINVTNVFRPQFKRQYLYPRYWLIGVLILVLILLSFLPWFVRSLIAKPIALLAYYSSRKRRRIAQTNLALCFPEQSAQARETIIKRHFYLKIRTALDYGFLWCRSAARLRRLIQIENESVFQQHFEANRPIILLTCHCLSLDHGATGMTLCYPGVGLVKPARNALADWLMQTGRLRFNAVLYARDGGIRPVARAIKKGVFFYYLPDEDIAGQESVFSQFFGVQALTLSTLGRLAKLCDAVILPSVTLYKSGRYHTHLFPALDGLPTGDREQDALRMNQEIEKLIQLDVAQYMWTMKRFNRRPDGEPDVY